MLCKVNSNFFYVIKKILKFLNILRKFLLSMIKIFILDCDI